MNNTTQHTGSGSTCPNCERYIGPVSKCPYCDADAEKPPFVKLLRWFAVILAVGGLGLLYMVAIHRNIPLTRVADITPTMNYAYVRITGKVTRRPYVAKDNRKVSFMLADESGEIRVEAFGNAAAQIVEQNCVPVKWSRVEVIGSLSVPAGRDPKLYVRSSEHISSKEKEQKKNLATDKARGS